MSWKDNPAWAAKEEWVKENVNPIVGFIFHSAHQLGQMNAAHELDWQYLEEGTARILHVIDQEVAKAVDAATRKHVFWAAGESDCPRDIKASNGELHTLQCKVCGEKRPQGPCGGPQ